MIVDIAADAGGNCAATVPGERIVTPNGVTILGYRNWPGRIPVSASSLYARNLLTFLSTFWDKDAQAPKLPDNDDIVKGVMLTRAGGVVHPHFLPSQAARLTDRVVGDRSMNPTQLADEADRLAQQANALAAQAHALLAGTSGVVAEVEPFIFLLAIFLMACFVGYYVVWNVTPALHSPLMSVTNAISSVIVVGAMLATGLGTSGWATGSASSPSCWRA